MSTGELAFALVHMHRLGYRLADVQREGGGVDALFLRLRCPAANETILRLGIPT